MSVLVKGMDMPKGCLECQFKDIGMSTMTQCLLVAGWVEYANDGYGIPECCPLVEVPVPHGRLIEFIDVPVFEDEDTGLDDVYVGDVMRAFYEMRNAPTVIEAEGE